MSHYARTLSLLFITVLSTCLPLHAQVEEGIKVSDVSVRVGDKIAPLVASLKDRFDVVATPAHNGLTTWLVSIRKENFPFAYLYSRGAAVVGVHTSLVADEPQTPDDLFNALYKAAAHVSQSHSAVCIVNTASAFDTDTVVPMQKTNVKFLCGPYRFYLLRNTFTLNGKLLSGFVLAQDVGETAF